MIVKNVSVWTFADICPIMQRAIASSSSFWISGDVYLSSLFRSHSMISGFSWTRRFSSWWKLEFSSDIVSVFRSPLNGKPYRAKYQMLWTGLRAKSFGSWSFVMQVIQIANHQYHLLLLRVPWHILRLPPYANQTIRAFEILSFSPLYFFSSKIHFSQTLGLK